MVTGARSRPPRNFWPQQQQIEMAPSVEIIELPDEPVPPPPAADKKPVKLYLATPCYGCQLSVVFLGSLLSLHAACAQQGVQVMVDLIGNESLVERARNILAARFLESDATHLLFIDADIGFRPEAVLRLVKFDKDVTTGIYAKKAFDWAMVKRKLEAKEKEPVFQMGLDFNINIEQASATITDGFVKVLDSATGFMLIKRAVMERMVEHYRPELHCVNDILGQTIKTYTAIFACMIDPDTRRFLSEDYSFCRRYQQLGGEIWADVASPLCHMGTNVFSGDVLARYPAAHIFGGAPQ